MKKLKMPGSCPRAAGARMLMGNPDRFISYHKIRGGGRSALAGPTAHIGSESKYANAMLPLIYWQYWRSSARLPQSPVLGTADQCRRAFNQTAAPGTPEQSTRTSSPDSLSARIMRVFTPFIRRHLTHSKRFYLTTTAQHQSDSSVTLR